MLPAVLLLLLVNDHFKCSQIQDNLVQDGRHKGTNLGLFSLTVSVHNVL